jgi:hypothetical protein
VHEFDGVFDGDDAFAVAGVDDVDHGGEGGGFAAAGGAGDEDESARCEGDLADYRGEPELFDGGNGVGDDAEGAAPLAFFVINIDAEAGHAGDDVGEIDGAVGLEALPSRFVEHEIGRAHV